MRKIFTFLFAALMSVGMYAQSNVQAVEFSVPSEWQYDVDGYYTAADLPGFTATTLEQALDLQEGISTTPGGILIYGFSGNQALYIWYNMYAIQLVSNDAKKIYLAESVYDYGEVVYYTAAPATYTLQLVADPEKGSVAVTNLLGSNIVDNGNGNYTVPENEEVTILATPNEGYEFAGWKVGNIDDMVGCYYCGTALNTMDNPMTITMTEDIAYLAVFEAPQPQETVVVLTEADYKGNNIFEKDGVTLTVARVDADSWYITGPGTFTNSLGKNFIKIEVTPVGGNAFIYGEGWEGDYQNKTWTGNAPTVSFNEDIQGQMEGFTATCTLEEPTGVENVQGNQVQSAKFFRDGQLLIEKNGKIYNAQGVEVR